MTSYSELFDKFTFDIVDGKTEEIAKYIDAHIPDALLKRGIEVAWTHEQFAILDQLLKVPGSEKYWGKISDNKKEHELGRLAVLGKNEDIKVLLDHGVNVNGTAGAPDRSTALMLATMLGVVEERTETVQLLLDRGADPGLRNWDGKSAADYVTKALKIALENKQLDVVDRLIKMGAAVPKEDLPRIRELYQIDDLGWFEKNNRYDLFEAIDWTNEKDPQVQQTFKEMVLGGYYQSVSQGRRERAMLFACNFGDGEAAKVLFGYVPKEQQKELANECLRITARMGKEDLVKTFLDLGANINAQSPKFRDTPLIWAVYKGNVELTRMLLDKGAAIDLKNSENKKAFDYLSNIEDVNTRLRMLQLGLEKGACSWNESQFRSLFNIPNKQSILDWALAQKNKETLELLLQSKESLELLLPEMQVAGNQLSLLHSVTEKGLLLQLAPHLSWDAVNTRDASGKTPVMLAIEKGLEEEAVFLLGKGAYPTTRWQEDQATLLMKAAEKGLTGVVKKLLEQKCPLNDQDREDQSALSYAVASAKPDIIQMLVMNGAQVTEKIKRQAKLHSNPSIREGLLFALNLPDYLKKPTAVYDEPETSTEKPGEQD